MLFGHALAVARRAQAAHLARESDQAIVAARRAPHAHEAVGELATVDVPRDRHIMQVNFMGSLHLFAAVRPSMLARKSGHFVGVASLAGFRGLPMSGAYSASKAAMQAFLESARVELKAHGITVTTVNPGFVKTPLTDRNTVSKPFMISAARAGVIVANGLERRQREVNFPEPTATAMRVLRLLPNWLFDAIVGVGARQLMGPENS